MQELMRHSTICVTLDTYTQAVTSEKRATQTAVVSLFVRKKKKEEAKQPSKDGAEASNREKVLGGRSRPFAAFELVPIWYLFCAYVGTTPFL